MKPISKVIAVLVMIMILSIAFPVNAEVLEKDANPFRMVLTQWGGISLEQQGQERFFKVWNRGDNSFNCGRDYLLSNLIPELYGFSIQIGRYYSSYFQVAF
jgi:hypothetical protein